MIGSFPKDLPRPPRLSMDEYADFVSQNLQTRRRDLVERQKSIEEQITARFDLSDEKGVARREEFAEGSGKTGRGDRTHL